MAVLKDLGFFLSLIQWWYPSIKKYIYSKKNLTYLQPLPWYIKKFTIPCYTIKETLPGTFWRPYKHRANYDTYLLKEEVPCWKSLSYLLNENMPVWAYYLHLCCATYLLETNNKIGECYWDWKCIVSTLGTLVCSHGHLGWFGQDDSTLLLQV